MAPPLLPPTTPLIRCINPIALTPTTSAAEEEGEDKPAADDPTFYERREGESSRQYAERVFRCAAGRKVGAVLGGVCAVLLALMWRHVTREAAAHWSPARHSAPCPLLHSPLPSSSSCLQAAVLHQNQGAVGHGTLVALAAAAAAP